MVRTHTRSPSPEPSTGSSGSLLKRLKTTHTSSAGALDPTPHFANNVLESESVQKLHASYITSEPFKYAVVDKLFQDELLRKVKDECLKELSFTEKETDIYKVNQTGDLASLSFLTPEQIALLPSLLTLRDALYSHQFRSFLRSVTGCGPLSGSKQDMSVNSYKMGCHLLNHDDVIGSRRVSYILYMPLPFSKAWDVSWGGALELYAAKEGEDGNEPENIPMKCIPPCWNQFVFFEVQPGRSFHSVEEVVVDGGGGEDGDERERLSISGWFHEAQEGEEGHEPEPAVTVKSSREQLTSSSTVFTSYPESGVPPLPTTPLSEEHITYLSQFLNPTYLEPTTMATLAVRFVEESNLELHSYLSKELAEKLSTGLREMDVKDSLGPDRSGRIPPHTSGTGVSWAIRGPPHKWRYCTLTESKDASSSSNEIIRRLQDELFPSEAFRAWLSIVSRLLPLRFTVEARRFRPGLDYTLATSEQTEARLDVCLGLTPEVEQEGKVSNGKGNEEEPELTGWQSGQWGGWECYMAPHDEEDDPAVYRSGSRKKEINGKDRDTHGADGDQKMADVESHGDNHLDAEGEVDLEGEVERDGDGDSDTGDGTLLTVKPSFNRLLLVLRDEGVMRFVKYVSAAAEGSRWDICGEFEVGMIEDVDNDEENDDNRE